MLYYIEKSVLIYPCCVKSMDRGIATGIVDWSGLYLVMLGMLVSK